MGPRCRVLSQTLGPVSTLGRLMRGIIVLMIQMAECEIDRRWVEKTLMETFRHVINKHLVSKPTMCEKWEQSKEQSPSSHGTQGVGYEHRKRHE